MDLEINTELANTILAGPTKDDEQAVEKLNLYGMGGYGDVAFDDFVKEYIIKDLSPIAVVRRLNYMIDQCSNEQVKRELHKHLDWRKCDEDVISELHGAMAQFVRFFDHAANVSPIPSDRNRDEVTTRLFNVLEWCKHHDKEFKTQLVNCPLLKNVEDLSVLATYICESADNWVYIVDYDGVVLELFNDIAMLLDMAIEPTMKKRNGNATERPEPQLSPTSGNADDVTHPDTSTPDFSHMESYSPNIQFDLSALYEFLIGESVIKDIDEKLFGDCISHAYMNEVWKVGNHHKLKCVFRHLKDHFSNDWIDIVAQRMNTTRKIITAIDRSKIKAFEFKLTDIL